MTALVEGESGAGAARRPPPPGPALVAHVVASNVPALALPAIALGCLAGAAVVVKSGRDDPVSAPAFVRALAAVDPDLAATIVATYWPGGDVAREDAVLSRADVVVATGGDAALAALAPRLGARLVAHGPRISAAVAATDDAARLAQDVALHDQRGCLSPHVVYVVGDDRDAARFADRLAGALDALAGRLPPGPAAVEARAAARVHAAEAEWASGARVLAGRGGCVIHERTAPLRPTHGRRTIRVHAIPGAEAIPALLPPGVVECVGVAGIDTVPLLDALRERGVSRVCPAGRMQRPSLVWPRGQLPPLGALLGRRGVREIQVER
jgi:acyl-CoA reductase-like NAD-dependent aldehyde dehydrogenase